MAYPSFTRRFASGGVVTASAAVILRMLAPIVILSLSGCVGVPDGVAPVENFNLERYLGKWYEIARLDHSFEEGLSRVTAEYSLMDDGGVRVLNRGWTAEDSSSKEAEGKAYFVDREDVGHLKVSFFGPFYGSYVVFGLDSAQYNYAMVCGPKKSYLWLLSRTKVHLRDGLDVIRMHADQNKLFDFHRSVRRQRRPGGEMEELLTGRKKILLGGHGRAVEIQAEVIRMLDRAVEIGLAEDRLPFALDPFDGVVIDERADKKWKI